MLAVLSRMRPVAPQQATQAAGPRLQGWEENKNCDCWSRWSLHCLQALSASHGNRRRHDQVAVSRPAVNTSGTGVVQRRLPSPGDEPALTSWDGGVKFVLLMHVSSVSFTGRCNHCSLCSVSRCSHLSPSSLCRVCSRRRLRRLRSSLCPHCNLCSSRIKLQRTGCYSGQGSGWAAVSGNRSPAAAVRQ
jgi:hypothetical protein